MALIISEFMTLQLILNHENITSRDTDFINKLICKIKLHHFDSESSLVEFLIFTYVSVLQIFIEDLCFYK